MSFPTRRDGLAALLAGAGALALKGVGTAAPATVPPSVDPFSGLVLRPEQIAQMRAALDGAAGQGVDFTPDSRIGLMLAMADPALRAQGAARLVDATLKYAKTLHSGQLAAGKFLYEWGLRPAAYEPAAEFAAAARAGSLANWLKDITPPYTGYDQLREGLAAYRALQAGGGWETIPAGPVLKIGATGERVAMLRRRLSIEDAHAAPPSGEAFDAVLAGDLMQAQKRYGLSPTGELDRATLAALNVPVETRVDQILANLERWRWLPRALPERRVQVNIAAAVLTLFQDDQPVMSMRAATGAKGHETPMLRSEIKQVVFNPPWNVPDSIARAELWPKERASPGYLARNGYRVTGGAIQQPAGPRSALGKVKFEFDNPYAVYLHDTPSRGAFEDYERLISHGCVRLQRPKDLLQALMAGDANWTPAKIDRTYAAAATVRAGLPAPVEVYLLYWTAYMGADGQMNFRDDPYGWDARLMRLLA